MAQTKTSPGSSRDDDGSESMTTPDETDIKRWAFRVRPETEQNETGWRATKSDYMRDRYGKG